MKTEIDINEICNVDECDKEGKDEYNMVIYFTKKDDTLWKIAKEFRSTIESVKKCNELTTDELMPGTELFIMKYVGVNG